MGFEAEERKSALRAAVAASLWATGRREPHVKALFSPWHAELVDDFCQLFYRAQAQSVSDVALARVAAEDSSAESAAARVLYGARSLLRGVQVSDATLAPVAANQTSLAPKNCNCESLAEALELVLKAGHANASAPRGLLQALRVAGQATDRPLFRTLDAIYGGAESALASWLCSSPFLVDPAAARIALAEIMQSTGGIRERLARAIAAMPGNVRPRALAALNIVDTVLGAQAADPSTLSVSTAASTALHLYAVSDGLAPADSVDADFLAAAQAADSVWVSAPEAAPLNIQVTTLLDGLLAACAGRVNLSPDDMWAPQRACITFADSHQEPLDWNAFAKALDVGVVASPPACTLTVNVRVSLDRALATFLMQSNGRTATANGSGHYSWPVSEAPVAFPVPAMTFSASRLNAYTKCPRRWFYDYLCDVIEDPGSLHAAYGRVVHEALEALHRYVRVPSRVEPASILSRLIQELDLSFGRARGQFTSQLEYEVSRMRARRIAEQYVRWLVAESTRAPFEIIHVELSQRQRFGAHEFVGFIDRIDRPLDGGRLTIYDYKTGRVDTDPAAYLEKVRSGEEAQLALYHAMRSASGDKIGRIALVSIRDSKAGAWVLALDVVDASATAENRHAIENDTLRIACTPADLEAGVAAIVARCDFLTTQGLAHYLPGEDPPCNFCAYARACRERPPIGERIFAR